MVSVNCRQWRHFFWCRGVKGRCSPLVALSVTHERKNFGKVFCFVFASRSCRPQDEAARSCLASTRRSTFGRDEILPLSLDKGTGFSFSVAFFRYVSRKNIRLIALSPRSQNNSSADLDYNYYPSATGRGVDNFTWPGKECFHSVPAPWSSKRQVSLLETKSIVILIWIL